MTSSIPSSALCDYTDTEVFIRDANLCRDLIGKVSFTEMMYFQILGTRPTPAQVNMLDAILVTLMEHGFTPSVIATRMVALSSPEAMQSAIAAGILCVGSKFIGTIEDSARLLRELMEGDDFDATARDTIAAYRAEKKLLPGFGHHLHRPDDPRSPVIFEVAERNGLAGKHVEAIGAFSKIVDDSFGRHVTINVTGAIGAVLADMEIPTEVIRGIAVVSRAAGLVGHILEESKDPAARFIWEQTEKSINHTAGTK